jgi:hypothetical protein
MPDGDRVGKPRTSCPWDPAEEALVRRHYASKGAGWIAERIERSRKAVMAHAGRLGVFARPCRGSRAGSVGVTPPPDPGPDAAPAISPEAAALAERAAARAAERADREREFRLGVERRKLAMKEAKSREWPEAGRVAWEVPAEGASGRINGQSIGRRG